MSDEKSKRIVVVTGASRGIGFSAAVALAEAGYHVVAIARTQGGLEELDDAIRDVGGTSTLVPMDITDFDAIDRLGAALFERYGRLDALLGNAGILGPMAPLGHVDPKKFEDVFRVNVTANFRLIRSLDPLLRQSPAGRAVFVSSGAAWKARAFWGPYAASKAGLDALISSYADEVRNFGVTANLLDPGPLRTRMRAQAMPGEDPMTLRTPDDLAPHIVAMLAPEETRTGLEYSFPLGAWTQFQHPTLA